MANDRTATTPAAYSLRVVLQRAVAYWRPYWPQASLIVLALLVFELFSTVFALSLKLIIDGIQAPRTSLPLHWMRQPKQRSVQRWSARRGSER
jgi:ABC-type multidrug transport system fused ATPase/permease subunit